MLLNEEQQQAIDSKDRFIFLLAGAGSGKTRTVIEKIKSLLKEGVNPKEILAITFTRKASEEMRERLNNDEVLINTFHGFCYQELQNEGLNKNIIDPSDTPFTRYELLLVSNYKNSLKSQKTPFILNEYQNYLSSKNVIDFDDIMLLFLKLKKNYQSKFKYIFVDEYQDTNNIQYEILKMLIGSETKVFAVGDPDQSIYRFRGAKPSIINLFLKEYGGTLLTLGNNYRSSQKTINCANITISFNRNRIKKKLVANKHTAGSINFLEFETQQKEAKYIIKKIRELIGLGYNINDIAIIYRNHNRSTIFKIIYYKSYLSCIEPGLNMLSSHESKGLEFKIVFLIGLEDGILPSTYQNQISEIEEERRLFFVSITRAMDYLFVSYVKKDQFGSPKKMSRFLKELNPQITKIS